MSIEFIFFKQTKSFFGRLAFCYTKKIVIAPLNSQIYQSRGELLLPLHNIFISHENICGESIYRCLVFASILINDRKI